MRSSLSTGLVLLFISFSFLFLGHHFGGRQGLLIGFILALSFIAIIYFNSDHRIRKLYAHRKLEGQDPWGLLPICEDIAKKIGIPCPEIYTFSFTTPTCLILGRHWGNAAIVLSDSLLERFSLDEVKSIVCLNFVRIQKKDSLSLGIAGALCGFLLAITSFFDNLLFWHWDRFLSTQPFYGPFSKLVYPIIYFILWLSTKSRSYYMADKLAAEILDDSNKVAEVLWKLHSFAATNPMEVPIDISALFIVNPLSKKWPSSLFHMGPSFDQRIKKLTGHFPL